MPTASPTIVVTMRVNSFRSQTIVMTEMMPTAVSRATIGDQQRDRRSDDRAEDAPA